MHRENRYWSLLLSVAVLPALGCREREDEEVQAVFCPRIQKLFTGEATANDCKLGGRLQRIKQCGVSARQVLARGLLGNDLLVDVGRTGRGTFPSAAPG